ncbi:MAG: zinc-dependent metalloprotease [Actinomycetota bacterium]|nr:zinc-dependent metalloprotease [Actinomycetota bacterium]
MSDLPFGFGSRDPGEGDDRPGAGGPGNPFGGLGGFDVSQLGQMLTQLGQMLSQASAGGGGPVNYNLAKQVALQNLSTRGLPSAEQAAAVADAARLAELWLDPTTELPAGASSMATWAPRDWVEYTLPTWRRLCDPVARRMAQAWVEALPTEARHAAGPVLAMLEQMGGLAFGSQLGGALGQLGGEVLTSTDIGLPLGPAGKAALLPANVERFATSLGRSTSEVTVFLAAREAAHHRLFVHVPWLHQRLLGAVEEFAQGIRVDTVALEELAREIDPSDPQSLERLMRAGAPEPKTTPEQQAALSRLETLLALIEGWVDVVVANAVGDRLPGAEALRETLRRRRASGGPAEQTFATLVGMELRPRKLRAASELWRELTVTRGVHDRDAVWNHPDLVPTAEDLDDRHSFVHQSPAASDLDDPITALERSADTAPREQGPGRPPRETDPPPQQDAPEGEDS